MSQSPASRNLEWLLRISVAMTFIGHGMYGFVFKKAWLPFYELLGFGPDVARVLMPLTGTMDVTLGLCALFLPIRAVFLHLSIWGIFTASLRPFAAHLAPQAQYSIWEVLERAGNYMPAIAVMTLIGLVGRKGFVRGLFEKIRIPELDEKKMKLTARLLQIGTVLLLVGHAGYGAIVQKTMLMKHYASIGLTDAVVDPVALVTWVGVFEFALAFLVAVKPANAVLAFVVAWKVATEALYVTASPDLYDINEWIERGGSYLAPLGMIYLQLLMAKGKAVDAPVVAAPPEKEQIQLDQAA